MIVACRFCGRPLPTAAPYGGDEVWEATCPLCAAFSTCHPPAVLVVSRAKAQAATALADLLSSVPNVHVLVDRRFAQTRRAQPANPFQQVERRRGERRRGGAGLILS